MAHQIARPMPRQHRYAPRSASGHRTAARDLPPRGLCKRWPRTGLARLIRFAITGTLAGLTQMALLALLIGRGWPSLGANATAFLLAAQLNFALSNLLTWRDRRGAPGLWRRWLLFHGAIAGMAVVNLATFTIAQTVLPTLVASAAGIGAAAFGNYLIGDRVVFRGRPHPARARATGGIVRVTGSSTAR